MSLIKPKVLTESSAQNVANQDHLFTDMVGSKLVSSTSHISSLKHSVYGSSSLFNAISSFSSHYPTHPWTIDTGATDHMVCSISYLTSITSIVSKSVRLLNGKFASVTHI